MKEASVIKSADFVTDGGNFSCFGPVLGTVSQVFGQKCDWRSRAWSETARADWNRSGKQILGHHYPLDHMLDLSDEYKSSWMFVLYWKIFIPLCCLASPMWVGWAKYTKTLLDVYLLNANLAVWNNQKKIRQRERPFWWWPFSHCAFGVEFLYIISDVG